MTTKPQPPLNDDLEKAIKDILFAVSKAKDAKCFRLFDEVSNASIELQSLEQLLLAVKHSQELQRKLDSEEGEYYQQYVKLANYIDNLFQPVKGAHGVYESLDWHAQHSLSATKVIESLVKALNEQTVWVRALRHSMDNEKPFPSVDKLTERITTAENATSMAESFLNNGKVGGE